MENSLSWKESIVVNVLKKYLFSLVLVSLIIGGLSVFASSFLKSTQYVATGQLVQNDNNYNLISSYSQFVNSSKFTNEMEKQINKSEWKNKKYANKYVVSVSNSSNSPFFSISVTSSSPEYAKFVTNLALKTLVGNVGKYLSGANITIVSHAKTVSQVSVKSSIAKIAVVGFVVTFILMFIIVLIIKTSVGKVKQEKMVEEIFGVKSLGTLNVTSIEK